METTTNCYWIYLDGAFSHWICWGMLAAIVLLVYILWEYHKRHLVDKAKQEINSEILDNHLYSAYNNSNKSSHDLLLDYLSSITNLDGGILVVAAGFLCNKYNRHYINLDQKGRALVHLEIIKKCLFDKDTRELLLHEIKTITDGN